MPAPVGAENTVLLSVAASRDVTVALGIQRTGYGILASDEGQRLTHCLAVQRPGNKGGPWDSSLM